MQIRLKADPMTRREVEGYQEVPGTWYTTVKSLPGVTLLYSHTEWEPVTTTPSWRPTVQWTTAVVPGSDSLLYQFENGATLVVPPTVRLRPAVNITGLVSLELLS